MLIWQLKIQYQSDKQGQLNYLLNDSNNDYSIWVKVKKSCFKCY